MSVLLSELKTRARLRLNTLRHGDDAEGEARLRNCLTAIARELGFLHWDQARAVLGGEAATGDDMGRFWQAPRSTAYLNLWFGTLDEARAAHAQRPALYLLPYRRQFVLVEADCIPELGLDPQDTAWAACCRDLVAAYGTDPWLALARQRLDAPAASFEAVRAPGAQLAMARKAPA